MSGRSGLRLGGGWAAVVELGAGSWDLGAGSQAGRWELDWDRERELGWDLEPKGRNPREFRLGGPKSAFWAQTALFWTC